MTIQKNYLAVVEIFVGILKKSLLYLPVMGMAILCLSAVIMLTDTISLDRTQLAEWLETYWSGSASFGEQDIWRWFGYGSLIFGFCAEVIAQAFNTRLLSRQSLRTASFFVLATSVSSIFVLLPFQEIGNNTDLIGLYLVFITIAFVTATSLVVYFGVSYVLDKIHIKITRFNTDKNDTIST